MDISLRPGARVLVVGASRGIGLETVRAALAAGFRVRGMARSADGIAIGDPAFEPFDGDATDPDDIARALKGVDAVVLTLGLKLDARTVLQPVTLFSTVTRHVVDVMVAEGPHRLIAVTGFGAGDSYARVSRLERVGLQAILGRAYDDKTRQEDIIRASALDWTILRPTILTHNRASGACRVLVSPEDWRNGVVPRADVAEVIVRALVEGAWLHEAPVLAR